MMKEGRGSRPYRNARFDETLKKHAEEVEPEDSMIKVQSSGSTDEQEPFMGMKVRRRSSVYRIYNGTTDYIDAQNNDQIKKLLFKQGDQTIIYAENVVKVTRKGKAVRRILIITDVALYTLDTQFFSLKRRIPLQSIHKLCLSECSDNFFAIIVPSEYDTLFASARKTEIVTILSEAYKKLSPTANPLEVQYSNKFEYYMDAGNVREVITEQIEGGVKTKFQDRSEKT